MDKLTVMFANWPMALVGLVLGVGQYMKDYGATVPATRAQWASFGWGLFIVVVFPAVKSAFTGSRPGTGQVPPNMESVLSARTPPGLTAYLPASSVNVIPLTPAVPLPIAEGPAK